MRGKQSEKKRKVFFSMFYSYIALLLLPLLITCLASLGAVYMLVNEVGKSNRLMVDQTAAMLDSHLNSAFQATATLLSDNEVVSLSHKYEFDINDIFELKDLVKLMNEMAVRCYIVSDLTLLYGNTNSIIGYHGISYGEEFAYIAEKEFYTDFQTFQNNLQFQGTQAAYFNRSKTDPKKGCLYLVNKNSSTYIKKTSGIQVIACIDTERLRNLLTENSLDGNFSVYLLDSRGECITSDKGIETTTPDVDGMVDATDGNRAVLKSMLTGKPTYYRQSSEILDWDYLYVVSSNQYIDTVRVLMLIFAGLFVFGIVGGTLLCYYFTKKQYSPLQVLVDRLMYIIGGEGQTTLNEYEIVERSLNSLINQNKAAEHKLSENFTIVQSNVLRDILTGNLRVEETLETVAEKYALSFPGKRFAVIRYSMPSISSTLLDNNGEDDGTALDMLNSFLTAIVSEYTIPEASNYSLVMEEDIIALLALKEHTQEAVLKYARETAAYMKKRYGIELLTGVSEIHEALSGIQLAYMEASSVIEYVSLLGMKEQIMTYKDLPDPMETELIPYGIISERNKQYANCMKAGDFCGASDIQKELIALYFREKNCSFEQARYRLFSLVNITISALEEIKPQVKQEIFEEIKPYQRLSSVTDVEGFNTETDYIYRRLEEEYNNKRKQSSNERDEKLLKYVQENYMDNEINIALLSDLFEMSPAHLSKTFKRVSGQGLLDYIHRLRIQKAKEMI